MKSRPKSKRREEQATEAPDKPRAGAQRKLRSALDSKSYYVDVAALARKKKMARAVTRQDLERLMFETIENVLLDDGADPILERDAFQERTRAEFKRLLDSHKQAIDERDEAEKSREDLDKQVRLLKRELKEQNTRLERETERAAPQIRFSEEALVEMEARVRGVLESVLAELRDDEAGGAETAPFERQLHNVLDQVMEEELDKARARTQEVRDVEIDRLRRRIGKLNVALESTEGTLRKVVATKGFDPGVASVYKDVQGLALDEVNSEQKREMIKVVFVNNLLLRDREVRPEDLEGVPEDFLIPREALSDESSQQAPLAPPVDPITDDTAY